MTKRLLFAAVFLGGLFVGTPAALAQVQGDPYTTPAPGQEQLAVAGTELVRTAADTPPRAVVGGTQQVRGGTLPVTGADITTLVAIGIGCIAVGSALRRRRQLTPR